MLEALHKNVVVAPLVDRRYEKFSANGDTIHVPGLAEIAASTLTNMTGSITFSANTESVTNIALNTLAYTAVKIDSAARVQSLLPEMELYTGELGRSVAEKFDTDILAEMDTTSNSVGTDNVDLTDDKVLEAQEGLDTGNVKPDERFMLISPKTKQQFFTIEKYLNSLYHGAVGSVSGQKSRGYLASIYVNDVYVTTNLPSGASGKVNFAYQREGIAAVLQQKITVRHAVPHDELAESVIAWCLYGVKLMRAAAVYEMRGK